VEWRGSEGIKERGEKEMIGIGIGIKTQGNENRKGEARRDVSAGTITGSEVNKEAREPEEVRPDTGST
jgi:hypothetical protein